MPCLFPKWYSISSTIIYMVPCEVLFRKTVLYSVSSNVFFFFNHPTLVPLTRMIATFICKQVFFFSFQSLGSYQWMGLYCLWSSLTYWVWQVDQYNETRSKISCHLSPTIETTGYSYHSGNFQSDFKWMWCWQHTLLPRFSKDVIDSSFHIILTHVFMLYLLSKKELNSQLKQILSNYLFQVSWAWAQISSYF